jgi:Glutaredoxin-like domain (DUF836)
MALIVYSRPHCHLCDELVNELEVWCQPRGLAFEVRDVDDDPATRAAYGLRIPVLVCDGVEICNARFDADALARAVGLEEGPGARG